MIGLSSWHSVAQPSAAEQNVILDVIDLTLFYQLGKPLDRFWVDRDGLHFDNLAILSDLAQSDQTTYHYRILHANGSQTHPEQTTRTNRMPLPNDLPPQKYYSIEIRTERPKASKHPARVFFYKWDTGRYQIIKVERDT